MVGDTITTEEPSLFTGNRGELALREGLPRDGSELAARRGWPSFFGSSGSDICAL